MKRYYIKSQEGRTEYMDIVHELGDELFVRVVRIQDGYEKVIEERMGRPLFETCLRTGYLTAA
jgi:hypothetical protein